MAIVLYLIVGLLYVIFELLCEIGTELGNRGSWPTYRSFRTWNYVLKVFTWPFRAVHNIFDGIRVLAHRVKLTYEKTGKPIILRKVKSKPAELYETER